MPFMAGVASHLGKWPVKVWRWTLSKSNLPGRRGDSNKGSGPQRTPPKKLKEKGSRVT